MMQVYRRNELAKCLIHFKCSHEQVQTSGDSYDSTVSLCDGSLTVVLYTSSAYLTLINQRMASLQPRTSQEILFNCIHQMVRLVAWLLTLVGGVFELQSSFKAAMNPLYSRAVNIVQKHRLLPGVKALNSTDETGSSPNKVFYSNNEYCFWS